MERAKGAGRRTLIPLVAATLAGIAIAASALLAQGVAPGEEFALNLRDHVVRIAAKWKDGSAHDGFGFIVGEDQGVYIVTADHVVRGKPPAAGPDELAETVAITYFRHQGQEFPAKLLGTHDAARDVAVLQAEAPAGFRLRPDIMRQSTGVPTRGSPVWYVGRANGWYVPSQPGKVNSVDLDERIVIDGLNVQVGTSGAPLVAADGIAGMVVSDEGGGVSRAIGIAFIERAFNYWAHPWQLRPGEEVAGPAPVEAEPKPQAAGGESGGVPPRGPPQVASPTAPGIEPPEAAAPPPPTEAESTATEGEPTPAEVRTAIQADLAHYDPSALRDLPELSPGNLAPALWITNPEVRFAGGQTLQVSADVALEGLALGRVSAVITPATANLLKVSIELGQSRWTEDQCAVTLRQQSFELEWNRAIAAFSGLRAVFSPVEVACPELGVTVGQVSIESALAEGPDRLWRGDLALALNDVASRQSGGDGPVEAQAIRLRFTFDGVDLSQRASALARLPQHYWPRRAALLGVPFDFYAASQGALEADTVRAYLGAEDFSAAVEDLSVHVDDGQDRILAEAKSGTLAIRSQPTPGLSYRHEGLSLSGAGVGLPADLTVTAQLARLRGDELPDALEALSTGTLATFLRDHGPLTIDAAGSGASSSAQASGRIWAETGAAAPSAVFNVVSDDPITFLLETLLHDLTRTPNPAALRQALEDTVLAVGQVKAGASGQPQYRFDIEADFGREAVSVNHTSADDVSFIFEDACRRYGC
jgi:hypothetical protein